LPSKRFLLLYADGSRAHISTTERDELLLTSKIRKLNEFSYSYIAPARIFHSFQDIEPLRQQIQPIGQYRRFLPGKFIIEFKQKRHTELLESAEGMAIRLQTA
jgi:hypothetical protein